MEGPVKRIFKLNLIIMRILGFYPPLRFTKPYHLYAYMVYVCLTIPVPTLAAIHLIVGENIDMAQVGDSCFIIFQVGCFIFKLTPFIFNTKNIRETIHMMEWSIFNKYNDEQKTIMDKCDAVCKRNTWLFLGFCVLSLITWAIPPFFGSAHKFPIEIWLPFDATSDMGRYLLTFSLIVLGVGNGAVSNGVIDPLVSGLVCFAATQLRILKNNLELLNTMAEQELEKTVLENLDLIERFCLKNQIIYQKIKECIDHHNAILEFIKNYEKVYSSVVFTQFMAAAIVICVSCLQLSMVEPFTISFFGMISFLITMLLEIFLYCYFGSTLYEESNSLTSAIYMGSWYTYDLKSRKALILLMERSKKPIVVTAGKVLDLSLVTFTTILRRAYSLLAVLNNYQ